MIAHRRLRADRRVAAVALFSCALMFVGPADLLAAACPECGSSPCRCGGGGMSTPGERGRDSGRKGHKEQGGGSRSRERGGGGFGFGVTIPIGPTQTRKTKDPFAVPIDTRPKTTAKTSAPPIAIANPPRILLDDHGKPEGDDPRDAAEDCCEFTSLEVQNTWERAVEVTLRNEHGAVTGQRTMAKGSKFTFSGKLGECIRITVKSPHAPHSLIEDVRICCKDVGTKNLYFYGIRLLSFTKAKCNDGMAGVGQDGGIAVAPDPPKDDPKDKATENEDPRDKDVAQSTSQPLDLSWLDELLKVDDGGQGDPSPANATGTGTQTRPPPPESAPTPTGDGSRTRNPTPDDPSDEPDDTDPRDAPDIAVRLGILLERRKPHWIPDFDSRTPVRANIFRWMPGQNCWVRPGLPRTITFEVAESSHETGRALNKGDEKTADIGIEAKHNPDLICSEDEAAPTGATSHRIAKTRKPVLAETLTLTSYDHGTFSKIRATASDCVPLRLTKGGQIVEATPEEALVDVPKDDNSNQIADAYEDFLGLHPRADEDEDYVPNGNGFRGDGLSAYEEYRGLYCQDTHTRGHWIIKDLFIHDRDNLGLDEYPRASQIRCHTIKGEEYDEDRVVNFNAGHANLVEQHGLLLVDEDAGPGYGGMMIPDTPLAGTWAEGRGIDRFLNALSGGSISTSFGPPKNVWKVQVGMSANKANGGTITHELGHATGMPHHGDGSFDLPKRWIHPAKDASWLAPWRHIHNSPGDKLGRHGLPKQFYIGEKHMQRSGVEDCYMRYYHPIPTAYPVTSDYWEIAEDSLSRQLFCELADGTGVNAEGRCGAGASPGRGACKKKLVVSDLYD